jgi:hypothetical protein
MFKAMAIGFKSETQLYAQQLDQPMAQALGSILQEQSRRVSQEESTNQKPSYTIET